MFFALANTSRKQNAIKAHLVPRQGGLLIAGIFFATGLERSLSLVVGF